MEKVDIYLGNFAKWRVRQLFVLVGIIVYCGLCFEILKHSSLNDNKYLPDVVLISALLIYGLIVCNKMVRPSQKTVFEFLEDSLLICTKSDDVRISYNNITYIEYDKVTLGGKMNDVIIGYKIYINEKSGHRIRLDYDVMDKNNPAFEDTELYQVYVLLKKYYR